MHIISYLRTFTRYLIPSRFEWIAISNVKTQNFEVHKIYKLQYYIRCKNKSFEFTFAKIFIFLWSKYD